MFCKNTLFGICVVFCATSLAQDLTDFIVIDQFGYREQAKKTAVIRVPQTGFGSPCSYSPSADFQVISETSGDAVLSGAPAEFNAGQTDVASGDKIWWFDFSSVKEPGRYYILDKTNNLRSFPFSISNDVYNNALKAAVKMFYYQRAGADKPSEYAGDLWADGFNFLQDARTRDFFAKTDLSRERDLSGGWFDAGDYNKYTKWTADYIESMLLTYEENPEAFTDDYGIPESGNGVPDILDEAKWGIDWLLKMQNPDGSVLSVQGLASGTPPSSVTKPSYYGPANTTAAFGTAKAFAIASRFFNERGETEYAENLKNAAIKAWDWAVAHPDSIFHNNQGISEGLAAGDQEITDNEYTTDRIENYATAAYYLYELTGTDSFLEILESNLNRFPLYNWGDFMDQYRHAMHMLYLRYLNNPNGNASVKSALKNKLSTAFAKANDFLGAYQKDGYRSFIKDYQWGSNKVKADYGLTFYKWDIVNSSADYKDIAEDYIHYIHGVNPFNMVYLTNMNSYGTSKSLTKIYHTWFSEESDIAPAPGYMPGGPNSGYSLDDCCPSSCSSTANNARCNLIEIPKNQPAAKMYKEMNHDWPLNSWEITEPSNGYQLSYIRLLSKFVGGNVTPIRKAVLNSSSEFTIRQSGKNLMLQNSVVMDRYRIFDLKERNVLSGSIGKISGNIDISSLPQGVYYVKVYSKSASATRLFVVRR